MKPIPLVDTLTRTISYVRLSVTDLCNFKCDYCLPYGYVGKKQPNELSLAEIKALGVALARVGVKKIRLTGGEPSLRKDLVSIIHTLKQIDGIEQIALTTNGYQLKAQAPLWVAAGLDHLNISVDSFDRLQFAKITGSNCLPDILEGIDLLINQGFENIKLNAVLRKSQCDQTLADALAYVKTRPVTMRFIELMQTQDNHAIFFSQHLRAAEIETQLLNTGWQAQPTQEDAGPARTFSHPDYVGKIGLITPYQIGFCSTCNRVRISSMGRLHLCLYARTAYDLRPLMQSNQHVALVDQLQQLIGVKPEAHFLHQANTGLIKHFAMLCG